MKLLSWQELKLYKEGITLSPIQKDFLIGTLLGDGNLRFVSKNKEASLTVDHGLKATTEEQAPRLPKKFK